MPFKFRGATISARPLSIADDDEVNLIAAAFTDGDGRIFVKHVRFAEFQVAGGFTGEPGQPAVSPIPHVTSKDDPAKIRESYEAWRALPRRFADEWRKELARSEAWGNESA